MSATVTVTPERAKRSLLNEILQASALYSLALIAQRVVGVLLFPLYTHYLAPSAYGLLDLMDQTVSLWGLLIGAQFSAALFYHYFQDQAADWRRRVVATTILGAAGLGVGSGLLGLAGAAPLSRLLFGTSNYAGYFYLLFASMAVSFPLEACFCWFKATNLAGLFVFSSILRLVLTIGITATLLVVYKLGILAILWGNLISGIVLLILMGAYCANRMSFTFDWELFVRMCRFSVPLALTGVAYFIIHFGDRFVLQRYVSLTELGVYSAGYKIEMLVSYIHSSFHTYWSAQIYEIVRREDGRKMFARVFTYMILVLATCALGLTLFAGPLLAVLATPAYYPAAAIVPVIVAAYFVRAIGDFFRCLLYVNNRPGLDAFYNWIGAGVGLAGYFLLVPPLGMWGAAIATLIIFVVIAVIAARSSYKILPWEIEVGRIVKIAVCAAVVLSVRYSLQIKSIGMEFVLGLGLLLFFGLLLLLLRFATFGELAAARKAVGTMTRRFA